MEYDFGGYATKYGVKCSDGRTITKGAFDHCDGKTVPLVWQHQHQSVENVLGNAVLESREDGVYAYCKLNSSKQGEHAKLLIEHGDIEALSIHANKLIEKGNFVSHGDILELSMVLAGANPGAYIDNLCLSHSDGTLEELEDEAIIYSGEFIEHADDDSSKTIRDVYNTMNEDQKACCVYLVAQAVNGGEEIEQSEDLDGGEVMKHNAFSQKKEKDENTKKIHVLTHDDFTAVVELAKQTGSFKKAFLQHSATFDEGTTFVYNDPNSLTHADTAEYGIEGMELMFPDAKNVTPTPDFIKRDTDWVDGVISGTKHVPYEVLKSLAADITADEARARGYVKGNLKKEEVIKLLTRKTHATTIYKKQKFDRDDIIQITDFNVVTWIRSEMMLMLKEEIARAILVGDGREVGSEDKIDEDAIRPIWKDEDLYAHHVIINASSTAEEKIEAIIRNRKYYKGKGKPTMYTTDDFITDMLLIKDANGRRIYNNLSEIADLLRVSAIIPVEPMEGAKRTTDSGEQQLLCEIVNLSNYYVGTNKGGHITPFDDFDIDYNQYKYLLETRMSGSLMHPKSALIIETKGGTSSYSTKNTTRL